MADGISHETIHGRKPAIDIVIPLYNEEKILERSVETLIGFLDQNHFPYQYVVTLVNNASTDSSLSIATDLTKRFPKVRIISLDKKGKGLAVRTAWENSGSDILSFMDTDLSSDLACFLPLIDEVALNGADLSIGNRLGPRSQVFSKRFMRKAASQAYNLMARVLLGTSFADHQCGFKAMKKEAFRLIASKLKEDGFFFDTELLSMSVRQGLIVSAVDIVWHDTDESKVSLFKDSFKMFFDVIRLRQRMK